LQIRGDLLQLLFQLRLPLLMERVELRQGARRIAKIKGVGELCRLLCNTADERDLKLADDAGCAVGV